jgi:hypothetical protein
MSISVPIRLVGGVSIFEISWMIQPVYIKGMMVTDGTWRWTFRGNSELVNSFVLRCQALIAEHNATGWTEVYPTSEMEVPPRTTEGSVSDRAGAGISDV